MDRPEKRPISLAIDAKRRPVIEYINARRAGDTAAVDEIMTTFAEDLETMTKVNTIEAIWDKQPELLGIPETEA
jgi:hypothetical protein